MARDGYMQFSKQCLIRLSCKSVSSMREITELGPMTLSRLRPLRSYKISQPTIMTLATAEHSGCPLQTKTHWLATPHFQIIDLQRPKGVSLPSHHLTMPIEQHSGVTLLVYC